MTLKTRLRDLVYLKASEFPITEPQKEIIPLAGEVTVCLRK